MVGALVVVGVLDQAPPDVVPNYRALAARYDVDATFFHQLEAHVPRGSMIFQFPIMVYPENGPDNSLADYGEFIGYLHTSTLRWSYGAMKGRSQGDWQTGTFSNLPVGTQMVALAAIGFRGVWVDRDGYTDHGNALEASLTAMLGPPTLVSSDQRMAYYDLGAALGRLFSAPDPGLRSSLAAGVLTATDEVYGPGFNPPDTSGATLGRWGGQLATLTLTNVTGHDQAVDLTATVSGSGPGTLDVAAGGAATRLTLIGTDAAPLHLGLRLAPGVTRVVFRTGAPASPDAPPPAFHLAGVQVAPPAVHAATCLFETGPTRPLDCG
jgi:phosphoglycerol transferase